MLVYEKKVDDIRKLFGSLTNIPLDDNESLIYRDDDGNMLPNMTLNDCYCDDSRGGIRRKSDGKKVNIYIENKNIIPGNFVIPTVHSTPVKVEDYLYEIEYQSYDLENANNHYRKVKPNNGACSSVRSGNFVGRNLDWNYDNKVSFLVRVPAVEGRHASIGVADCVDALTKEAVESGEELEAYKYLPYATVDGINDAGVYVNTNIVLLDYGIINDLNPGRQEACTVSAIRLILDNADSAEDALKIFDKYNFYGTSKIGEDPHYMIADSEATYIVEFIEDYVHIMSDQDDEYDDIPNKDKPIMTNFPMSFWTGEPKLVCQGYTDEEVLATRIPPHAMGVERYKLLFDNYSACTSYDQMKNIIDLVKYSKLYDIPDPYATNLWRTENVGYRPKYGDLTVYSTVEDYKQSMLDIKEDWQHKSREDGKCWQTVHCSIYNLDEKKLYLRVQEQDVVHEYTL